MGLRKGEVEKGSNAHFNSFLNNYDITEKKFWFSWANVNIKSGAWNSSVKQVHIWLPLFFFFILKNFIFYKINKNELLFL